MGHGPFEGDSCACSRSVHSPAWGLERRRLPLTLGLRAGVQEGATEIGVLPRWCLS